MLDTLAARSARESQQRDPQRARESATTRDMLPHREVTMQIDIRPFVPEDRAACAAILERLPDWFGIPESNASYLRGLAELPSFVALADGVVVGFASMHTHFPESAEIEVIAVDPAVHRRGIGVRLVERLELELARRGRARVLHVKTLGPSDPDPGYARTRAFLPRLPIQGMTSFAS